LSRLLRLRVQHLVYFSASALRLAPSCNLNGRGIVDIATQGPVVTMTKGPRTMRISVNGENAFSIERKTKNTSIDITNAVQESKLPKRDMMTKVIEFLTR
jgi:hypothetical protein